MQYNKWSKVEKVLKNGGVVIAPTDTLYGILASAKNKNVVNRIYKIKGRDSTKPFIILITNIDDLKYFGIKLDKKQREFMNKIWPGKVSVEIPYSVKKFSYLHRDFGSNAFRMIGPKNKNLFNLINKVGPLVAPSANPQGESPALNIKQARKYFGDSIDGYFCGGTRMTSPSTLIQYKDGNVIVLRQGSVKIKKD